METTTQTKATALDVTCPRCGATAGQPCRTPAGRTFKIGRTVGEHRERQATAARAADLDDAREWGKRFAEQIAGNMERAREIAEGK